MDINCLCEYSYLIKLKPTKFLITDSQLLTESWKKKIQNEHLNYESFLNVVFLWLPKKNKPQIRWKGSKKKDYDSINNNLVPKFREGKILRVLLKCNMWNIHKNETQSIEWMNNFRYNHGYNMNTIVKLQIGEQIG